MLLSPLIVYYYTTFSGYKDKEYICNRQRKTQLSFTWRKNYQSSLVSSRLLMNSSRLLLSSLNRFSQSGTPFLK